MIDFPDYDGDIILYYGPISRGGYDQISDILESSIVRKNKVCLALETTGGDPDAGYRIARALNHYYENVEVLISGICKSAGTLVCLGARKIIFGDRGELGPLDIQLSKPEELNENISGLVMIQAINALQEQMLSSFRENLVDIRHGSQIRTKMAADIAVKLAEGFVSPIAAKIDPVTLGEHQRAMQIAFDYGGRLSEMSENVKADAMLQLVVNYPSHSFVIDRKEARNLFHNVESPDETNMAIYDVVRDFIKKTTVRHQPIVISLSNLADAERKDNENLDAENLTIRDRSESNGSGANEGENEKSKRNKQDDTNAKGEKGRGERRKRQNPRA